MAINEYHSFSGVDIHAVFEDTVFGEIQMVSYKTDREKAPVYTMGSANLRTIARGKRLVSGACVFVVFDRDSLIQTMDSKTDKPFLSKEETANNFLDEHPAGGSYGGFDTVDVSSASAAQGALVEQRSAYHADQLLPFAISLVGANEYGQASKMVIHGVELMSEAGGVSIDDLVLEKQMSFIARKVSGWTNV